MPTFSRTAVETDASLAAYEADCDAAENDTDDGMCDNPDVEHPGFPCNHYSPTARVQP